MDEKARLPLIRQVFNGLCNRKNGDATSGALSMAHWAILNILPKSQRAPVAARRNPCNMS